MNRPSPTLILCLLLGTAGLSARWLPTPELSLPEPQEQVRITEVEARTTTTHWQSLANQFSVDQLPQSAPAPLAQASVEPIAATPDPTEQLHRWVVNGIVQTDTEAIASLHRDTEQILLRTGDKVATARVINITSEGVVFETDDGSVTLPLETP